VDIVNLFFSSLLVGYSGALPPGSLLTVVISQSARRGWKAGPLLIAGHAALELILVIGIMLGLNRVLTIKAVGGGIGVVGGLFLAWMAWGILRDAPKLSLSEVDTKSEVAAAADRAGQSARPASPVTAGNTGVGNGADAKDGGSVGLFVTGAVASLSNPYWLLWWAVGGTAFVMSAAKLGALGVAFFYVGHILADFTWYTFVSAAIAAGRKLMSDGVYRGILVACGLALVFMAVGFIFAGARTLIAVAGV
jgi:threonine/homoserine/homoserine lactone efflux protein